MHARCRYCCLHMTQSWLLKVTKISNTTLQHYKKQRENKNFGINWVKANTMVVSKEPMECNIEVKGRSVKIVPRSLVHTEGWKENCIDRRIGIATSAVGAMQS